MVENPKIWPSIEELHRPDTLRLHCGELDANELLVAQAAVRYCYSQLLWARTSDQAHGTAGCDAIY